MVKDKKFPYTANGKKEAQTYANKTGAKEASKPAKKMAKKNGY